MTEEYVFDFLKILFGILIPIFLKIITSLISNVSLNWRLANTIRDLRRHLKASKKSVKEISDSPVYKVAARIKYCMYLEDSMISQDRLRILKKRSYIGFELLFRIRNYDIFLEEVANRVDLMSKKDLVKALGEVEENIIFLEKYLDRHRLSIDTDGKISQMMRLICLG